jgi:hypothetical protein
MLRDILTPDQASEDSGKVAILKAAAGSPLYLSRGASLPATVPSNPSEANEAHRQPSED